MTDFDSKQRRVNSRVKKMHEICSHCGCSILRSRTSLREVIVIILCGGLVIAILLPICLAAQHWLEDAGHRFTGQMISREPVERW